MAKYMLWLFVLACSVLTVVAQEVNRSQPDIRQGWIYLGAVQPMRNTRFLGLKSKWEWTTQTHFEIVGYKGTIPEVADRIALKNSYELRIVDFRNSGEAKLNTSPADRGMLPDDRTGAYLSSGKVVVVNDISLSQPQGPDRIRAVWALVESRN